MVRVRPMLPRELSFDAAVEVTSPVSDCMHSLSFSEQKIHQAGLIMLPYGRARSFTEVGHSNQSIAFMTLF